MVITDKIWEQLFPTIEKGQEFITREDLEKGIENNTYQLFKDDNCSLVTSIFTLQFMPKKDRETVIERIYDGLNIGGAFILVPAMIYIIGMPTKLFPGTSLFVTIFISAIVTILHAFNYGSIDLILVSMLILGSIIGVQCGQKIGEFIDSTELKTLLAILLLGVGIAIAYDTFFAPDLIKEAAFNGTKTLGPFSSFIKELSKDFPIQYGILSIILAIVLGIGAAFVRRFFSNLRKKYVTKN